MTPRILIMGTIFWAHDELKELLGDIAEVVHMESASRDELFKDLAPGGRYADIVGIYHEHESHHKIGLPDKQMINELPSSVKWIAHKGAGYDQFDVGSCKARGIGLSNTPGAVDEATATTAVYLLIATMRHFSICEQSLRAGTFKPPHVEGVAHDLGGRTLGIIGMGSIGLRFAEMVRPFQMRIVYHNRRKARDAPDYCEYFESLDEMLKVVDVLSVNMPLTPETVGFVGKKVIRAMKPGGIIINTARGKIIDEEALLDALEDGHLAAVGLDVFPDEPKINPRLLKLQNTTLLPHVGTENQDARRKMEVKAITNLRDFLISGKGQNLVVECK